MANKKQVPGSGHLSASPERPRDSKTLRPRLAKPAPLKEWDSHYPDLPNILDHPRLEECDAIFESVSGAEYSDEDLELFHAAMLKRFITKTRAGQVVEPFIANWLIDVFTKALMGAAWDEVIQLPGRELPAEWGVRHPIDERDLNLFCSIANMVRAGGDTVASIECIAKEAAVSFETARTAYYKWLSRLPDIVSKSTPKI